MAYFLLGGGFSDIFFFANTIYLRRKTPTKKLINEHRIC